MTARRAGLIVLAVLVGCVSPSPPADIAELDRLLGDRGGPQVSPAGDDPVSGLLARELAVDSAIRVAVLRNRGLAARLANLGLTRADLIEVLTPENPQLDGLARFPDTSPRRTNFEFSVMGRRAQLPR